MTDETDTPAVPDLPPEVYDSIGDILRDTSTRLQKVLMEQFGEPHGILLLVDPPKGCATFLSNVGDRYAAALTREVLLALQDRSPKEVLPPTKIN